LNKKYFKKSWLLTLLPLLLAGGLVSAAANPLAIPSDPEQSSTLAQRLTAREKTYKVQLSASQSQKIVSGCKVSQAALTTLRNKDATVASTRQQTYQDLAIQLNDMIANLQNESVDASSLTHAQTVFDNAINSSNSDSVNYKTALDDAIDMNCASDPTGFEASILDARALRTKLASDSAAIKVAVLPIKQSISQIKQVLITKSKN